MAWDFSTEPEFQEQLDWVEQFCTEEVDPVDLLFPDAAKSKDYLPKAFGSLKTERTAWSVFAGAKTGPDNGGINPDADITVVVSDGAKAKFSKGYRSINETEVPKVFEALPPKK